MKNTTDYLTTGFFAQFTTDQIKRQYRRNTEMLVTMADKAVRTGKKVGGFRAGELVDEGYRIRRKRIIYEKLQIHNRG